MKKPFNLLDFTSYDKHFTVNDVYYGAVNEVAIHGKTTENNKGDGLVELRNVIISMRPRVSDIAPTVRPGFSLDFAIKELGWYLSGDCSLESAMKCTKFWGKCSDDGKTVTSNYGHLLLFKKNEHGETPFSYALACLLRSESSKKAYLPMFGNEHAYISKDNPCTQGVLFYVEDNQLHMNVYMRSNDLWFGFTYDVIWYNLLYRLMLEAYNEIGRRTRKNFVPIWGTGVYNHIVGSLHYYKRNEAQLMLLLEQCESNNCNVPDYFGRLAFDELNTSKNLERVRLTYTEKFESREISIPMKESIMNIDRWFMDAAWLESKKSRCLKKHCGAVIVIDGEIVGRGYGDRHGEHGCEHCARDANEKFYSDGCYSVHAEMRALFDMLRGKEYTLDDMSRATVYVTHGPCDACCKMLNFAGCKHIVYDEDYKTDYTGHWPELKVEKLTR